MKFICFTMAFLAASPVFSADIPEYLPIGKMETLEKLSSASKINVKCSAPGEKTFRQTVVLPKDFQSTDEVALALEEVKVEIPPNPVVTFTLSAEIIDLSGEVTFEAERSFQLEKVYGKEGLRFEAPYWAGDLYFWLTNPGVYFPDAEKAYFFGEWGGYSELDVQTGHIQTGYYGDGVLLVVTSSGKYYYDWNTGKRISGSSSVDGPEFSVENIRKVDSDEYLGYVLYPEWEYVPWLEIQIPPSGEIELNINSMNGYRPTGVWLRTMDQMRSKEYTDPVPYYRGVSVEGTPGDTIYLFFDFPDYVWGMGSSGGGGGGKG